jgi:hypothetical protein
MSAAEMIEQSLMKLLLLTILLAWVPIAEAGDMARNAVLPFPPLETLVGKADLVLRCHAKTVGGERLWQVVEALKGEYRDRMFDLEHRGFIRSSTGIPTVADPFYHDLPLPKHDEEIVFVQRERLHFGDDDKWHGCYSVEESLPVVGGKVSYPKTVSWGDSPPLTVEREFTLAEFRAAITSAVSDPLHVPEALPTKRTLALIAGLSGRITLAELTKIVGVSKNDAAEGFPEHHFRFHLDDGSSLEVDASASKGSVDSITRIWENQGTYLFPKPPQSR